MQFYSTSGGSQTVGFREAVFRGLAPDGGLYMPGTIPRMLPALFEDAPRLDFREICFRVAEAVLGDDVPPDVLRGVVNDAMSFDAPLIPVDNGLWSLELFHGPTLAFKDFGARFMSRLLSHLNSGQQELVVLVATSGDTGSAVAHGFFEVSGIRVVVLYPAGRVSEIQEKQMATLGGNITALEIAGSFDDCQRLAKQAFQDPDLNRIHRLTSANSINIARLIPQCFYYFYAWSRVNRDAHPVSFAVPSGNFGNLTAGLMAMRMGLPVGQFIAATNRNDVVPEYLDTGSFRPRPSLETISNAMDVGNPSNFARMLELCGKDIDRMRADVTAASFTDDQTRDVMREVYERTGYVLDPHGAVACLGARRFEAQKSAIFLETAHPAKFLDVVESVLGIRVEIPERLRSCLEKPKLSIPLSSDFKEFKEWLLSF